MLRFLLALVFSLEFLVARLWIIFVQYLVRSSPMRFWVDQIRVFESDSSFQEYCHFGLTIHLRPAWYLTLCIVTMSRKWKKHEWELHAPIVWFLAFFVSKQNRIAMQIRWSALWCTDRLTIGQTRNFKRFVHRVLLLHWRNTTQGVCVFAARIQFDFTEGPNNLQTTARRATLIDCMKMRDRQGSLKGVIQQTSPLGHSPNVLKMISGSQEGTLQHPFRYWMWWERQWSTGNVRISTANWISVLKILRIVHTIYFIFQFLYSAW